MYRHVRIRSKWRLFPLYYSMLSPSHRLSRSFWKTLASMQPNTTDSVVLFLLTPKTVLPILIFWKVSSYQQIQCVFKCKSRPRSWPKLHFCNKRNGRDDYRWKWTLSECIRDDEPLCMTSVYIFSDNYPCNVWNKNTLNLQLNKGEPKWALTQ